jgi:cytidylate kinase
MKRIIVAIDGPAGAGKGTVAKRLAELLDYVYIDTGAMYRAVALVSKRQGVDWEDAASVAQVAQEIAIEFKFSPEGPRFYIDGVDESSAIRAHDISNGASIVGQHEKVRLALDEKQQALGKNGGIVMEGRDITTRIFPEAEVKIFLTATPETRARRRMAELTAKTGEAIDFATILAETKERDERDSNRQHSPLRKADDAIEIYTDDLTIDEVVEKLLTIVRMREN